MLKSLSEPKSQNTQDEVDDVLVLIRMIQYLRDSLTDVQKPEVDLHLEAAAKALRKGLN